MTPLRKAAQMALDALEHGLPIIEDFGGKEQLQLQHKAIAVLYEALRAALAQPEQEPVAWMHTTATGDVYFRKKPHDKVFNPQPVYTASPQREWQGLTDEELLDIADMAYANDLELLQTLQAKLKEKNK